MLFHKKTIRDIPVDEKVVLIRCDFNVPLEEDGTIADDYRIKQALPTLQYLLRHGARVVACSHLGRPDGHVKQELSLAPVAERLAELLGATVDFAPDCIGDQARQARKRLKPGQVMLLENLRFHIEEKHNDREFAKELARGADFFVQDGFGVVHRAHASTEAVTHLLPSVAGFLVQKEVETILQALKQPKEPVVAIVGGAKIHDKIDLLKNFMRVADVMIVGGAMANTFLAAKGFNVGSSVYDANELGAARTIVEAAHGSSTELVLPDKDVAVGDTVDDTATRREIALHDVADSDIILDFGQVSIEQVLAKVKLAGTVLWNGPLGMTELKAFSKGSESVARFLAEQHINSIIGGGDTAGFVSELGLMEKFTHVSTGGGASLDLMAGKSLPGIAALLDV